MDGIGRKIKQHGRKCQLNWIISFLRFSWSLAWLPFAPCTWRTMKKGKSADKELPSTNTDKFYIFIFVFFNNPIFMTVCYHSIAWKRRLPFLRFDKDLALRPIWLASAIWDTFPRINIAVITFHLFSLKNFNQSFIGRWWVRRGRGKGASCLALAGDPVKRDNFFRSIVISVQLRTHPSPYLTTVNWLIIS